MSNEKKKLGKAAFPSIKADMLGRLSDEADLRTLPPQEVDWEEIHKQAEAARKKS
jgi:hypothetical protein